MKYWALRNFLKAQGIQLPLGSETLVRDLLTSTEYSELVSTPAAVRVLVELWGARIFCTQNQRTVSLEVFPYRSPEQLTTEYSALLASRDFLDGTISIVGRCSLFQKRVYYPAAEGDIEETTFVAIDAEGVWYTVQGDMAYFLACDLESALTALFLHPTDRSRLLPFLVPLG